MTSGEKARLLFFTATWCGPCRLVASLVRRTTAASLVSVVTVDVDDERPLAQSYKVENVPTLILLDGGEERGRMVGAVSRSQLEDFLKTHLSAA